jgi:hypothetical protein
MLVAVPIAAQAVRGSKAAVPTAVDLGHKALERKILAAHPAGAHMHCQSRRIGPCHHRAISSRLFVV